MLKKLKKVPKPKVTFSGPKQLYFTLKEVVKIALKINKKYTIGVFLLNAIWGSSAVLGFYLEKLILDELVSNIGNPNTRAVVYSVGLLVAVRVSIEIARSLLSRMTNLLRRNMSRLLDSEFDLLMSKKISNLDTATLEDSDFQDKLNKIQNESGRRAWSLMMPISDIPNYLIGFLSMVGVLFLIHPSVALFVILFSIPQVLIDSKIIKKDYELRSEMAPHNRKWGWIKYFLIRNRNFSELKILNISDYLSTELKSIQDFVNKKLIDMDKRRMLSRSGSELPFSFLELGITLILITWVVTERITIGTFQLYLRSLRSAEQNLTALVNSFLEIYENYIYVVDLVWLLELEPQIENKLGGQIIDIEKDLEIEFRDVWFRYKDDGKWILKGVSFKINPKENIALVGLNGSGKSTLIKLLARFYDPQKGEVLVNGISLSEINLKSWRRSLAVLFQEFESYPFTVQDSIGYGDIDRLGKIDEIVESAKLTDMHGFVESLPLKYKNPLDPQFDKGVRPSTGQAQRFGISRMLFRKNANIVIMDEPTASVDPEAEEKIFRELISTTRNKILIFVTQRFSTVRLADKILVMGKGKIAEMGTHEELMKLKGRYADLFTLQAQAYLDS